MSRRTRLICLCLLFAILAVSASAQTQPIPGSNRTAALEVLSRVNAWRVENGLFPLIENETLTAMALAQANYVYPRWSRLAQQGLYHQDADGRDPRARAVQAYNWPVYGRPDRVEIGENAASGSIVSSVGFWQTSAIHTRTALNPTYREAGVAALPAPNGFIIYIVFGARPYVLPALASPDGANLYLSRESSRYSADTADPRIRIFDSLGRPLSAELPWQPVIALPAGASGQLTVLYTYGSAQAVRTVDLTRDIALVFGATQPTTPTTTPTSPPVVATNTPAGGPGLVPPSASSTPAATATQTPAPAASANTLTLTISRGSLLVRNTSPAPIDITGLEISSSAGRIVVSTWLRVAQFNTARFSPRDCLAVSASGSNPNTADCRFLLSSVQFPVDRVFWRDVALNVTNNGTVVGTCAAGATTCVITWP
jgi:uncharacterized protein YkwD